MRSWCKCRVYRCVYLVSSVSKHTIIRQACCTTNYVHCTSAATPAACHQALRQLLHQLVLIKHRVRCYTGSLSSSTASGAAPARSYQPQRQLLHRLVLIKHHVSCYTSSFSSTSSSGATPAPSHQPQRQVLHPDVVCLLPGFDDTFDDARKCLKTMF